MTARRYLWYLHLPQSALLECRLLYRHQFRQSSAPAQLVSQVGIWSLFRKDLLLQASCQSSLALRLPGMISVTYEGTLCVVKSPGLEEKGRTGSRVGDI